MCGARHREVDRGFPADDVVVHTDGNFPFQIFFNVPFLPDPPAEAPMGPVTVAVTVRASDTGGNKTTTAPQVIEIVPDIFPPQILTFSPSQGQVLANSLLDLTGITVRFDEPLQPATIDQASVTVDWAGLDGVFDNVGDPANLIFRGAKVNPIPEPNTALLVSLGLVLLRVRSRAF